MDKKEIRSMIRARLKAMPLQQRAESSEAIFAEVERMAEFAAAHTVAMFMPLADEPFGTPFADRWSRSKRIVIPRVEGDDMTFCDYDPSLLTEGAFGIVEPSVGAAVCRPGEIDFMIVPATAYTAGGERLGRGKGFYDRYMAQPGFRAFTAGVCFACQLVGELPVEPHDRKIDRVVCG